MCILCALLWGAVFGSVSMTLQIANGPPHTVHVCPYLDSRHCDPALRSLRALLDCHGVRVGQGPSAGIEARERNAHFDLALSLPPRLRRGCQGTLVE